MYKNNCGKYNNDDCGDDDYMKLIKIDCCDELKNIEKTDINYQKLLEKISKKNKNLQDHSCYELHLGYSEKQMQKQV